MQLRCSAFTARTARTSSRTLARRTRTSASSKSSMSGWTICRRCLLIASGTSSTTLNSSRVMLWSSPTSTTSSRCRGKSVVRPKLSRLPQIVQVLFMVMLPNQVAPSTIRRAMVPLKCLVIKVRQASLARTHLLSLRRQLSHRQAPQSSLTISPTFPRYHLRFWTHSHRRMQIVTASFSI